MRFRLKKILLLSIYLTLSAGCSQSLKPFPVPAQSQYKVRTISAASSIQDAAVSADGQGIAWSDSDLNLFDMTTGKYTHLLRHRVDHIVWSPDSQFLAAVYEMDGESHLNIFNQHGALVYRHHLPGLVGRMQWPQSDQLSAAVLTVKRFSFGTHLKGLLIQWDGRWRLSSRKLYETTISPAMTARLEGQLHKVFDIDLSPLGDEVLYTRLHAPPAFAPSRHLVLQNLQTGAEKNISTLPILEGRGQLDADGESVYIQNGLGQVQKSDLWTGKEIRNWPGSQFTYDAGSGFLKIGNQIYQGDLHFEFPESTHLYLSLNGTYMLANRDKGLYLIYGYDFTRPQQLSGVDIKKLQKLRRLRSRGLIEPAEYRYARERLLQ